MLTIRHSLSFPKIIFVKEAFLYRTTKTTGRKSKRKTKEKAYLYKLDWSKKDKSCKERETKMLRVVRKPKGGIRTVPFIDLIPKSVDRWLKELVFAIDDDYMQGIRRNSRKGFDEWNEERPFDSAIRDMCLMPAEKFIEVAFRLLDDCIFDEKKHYWYTGPKKWIIWHALVYKFWAHQTGNGLLSRFAHFEDLWKIPNDDGNIYSKEQRNETKIFLEAVGKQYDKAMYSLHHKSEVKK